MTVLISGEGSEISVNITYTTANSDPFFRPRKQVADDRDRIGAGFENLRSDSRVMPPIATRGFFVSFRKARKRSSPTTGSGFCFDLVAKIGPIAK